MGLDICLFAERRVDSGVWCLVDDLVEEPGWRCEASAVPFVPRSIDVCRNYDLFAILAGVRWGDRREPAFAPPVSNDRGLPSDISRELRDHRARFRYAIGDGWFTYEELLYYDWSRMIEKRGFVARDAAHLFEGCPLGFPVHDQRIRVSQWSREGVEVHWRDTCARAARLEPFVDALRPYLTTEGVRFVFWSTS